MARLVIADDEPIALKRLEIALQCVPEMDLVAKATNGPEALALIRQTKPDIAILDVQMPGRSGLDVAAELKAGEHMPEIIFLTAYENHAIRAFELNAVDYVVKPAPFERLRESLRRAQDRLRSRSSDERFSELQKLLSALSSQENEGRPAYQSELWVRERGGLSRLAVDDIELLEAAGDYVIAHVGSTTHLLTESITSLQAKLDPEILLRIHRCSIVNLKRIRRIHRRGRRGLAVILANGSSISIGPSYTETTLKAVNAKRWR